MTRFSKLIATAVAAATLASVPAMAAESVSARAEARLAKALEGRVAGEPVRCINLRDIQSTQIIDRTGILYRTNGGKLYLNRPTSGAASLDRSDVMVIQTSLSQLCNVDVVHLYDSGSRMQSGFVGLGDFVPYTRIASR